MEYKLTMPLEDITMLRAGDTVLLSGEIYTARDAAHGRLVDLIDQGESLPFPLAEAGIYYVGPTPHRPDELIGSAGPTTSGRMDAYTPKLLDLGLKVMIGKGRRDQGVKDAVVRNQSVYLAALGGAGALMADGITQVEVLCWEDLGCEAVRKIRVQDLPLTVVLDCHGGDLYELGPKAYLESLAT